MVSTLDTVVGNFENGNISHPIILDRVEKLISGKNHWFNKLWEGLALFGPFVHGINKGGLNEIISTQQLLSTVARGIAGGGAAVRAHVGDFAALFDQMNWGHNPTGK